MSRQQSGKSAHLEPVTDDVRAMTRQQIAKLSTWEVRRMGRQWWDGYSVEMFQCRSCSHAVEGHVRGWCDECAHECLGTDTLHEAGRPAVEMLNQLKQKFAKGRR